MRRIAALLGLAAMAALIPVSPALAGWDAKRGRQERAEARETVASFQAEPELQPYFREAWGYAVFPTVGQAAFFFGGAYGTGEVYEQGNLVGSARISKGSVGFQIGGEAYSEIVFFRTRRALERFEKGGLAFDAGASATAITVGANVEAAWSDGVAVFARSKGGLMASAAVGGQTFQFEPISRRAG
jgi:lipid-binding SYLF domain-containing protein